MYKFSAPMPYTKEDIDKLLNINNQVDKSRITSLYACVPRGCEVFTGFEQSRNFAFNNVSWNYWKRLINYTLDKGCDFIYLLNSPKPMELEKPNFYGSIEQLDKLINELRKIGVNKIRVASAQLMSYIGKHYNDFSVFASTSVEYKTIQEYQNFFHFHPEIKQIVPSHDLNKNFKLLKNIKKRYTNIDIEIMVNEGCLQGCPNRVLHEMIEIDKDITIHNEEALSMHYATSLCYQIIHKYPIQSLIMGNLIFPFELEKYKKIGITKFKFVGRDGYLQKFENYINGFTAYLKGIDNIKNIETCKLSYFSHHLNNNVVLKQLTVSDCKKYLPKIEHFEKYGHLCASRCAVECRYCYKCAEKIQKVFEKKMKQEKKYVPACKITT